MRKNFYLIIVSLCFVSCYTYQIKKPVDTAVDNKNESKKNSAALANTSKTANVQQPPKPMNVQEELSPNKNFKIDVEGKSYKIIVDRWEGDSLVAHAVNKPELIMKFHKKQINAEKIAEKRFSKPLADIITITAYAGIGAGVWYLLQ